MFTLNEHIEYLMMHHDCVVIPGWGALVAQYGESFYDANRRELEPPVRKVGFNASVNHNDGLLAQSLVRREGLTYDEAVRFIDRSVATFRHQLAGGGELGMGRLGFFHSDAQGHVEFIPFYHEMCTDQYFGLRSVRFTPLEELGKEAAHTQSPMASDASPARAAVVSRGWLRQNAWRTAASIAVLLGLTVLLSTPIVSDRDQHDMASLSLTEVMKPRPTDGRAATSTPTTSGTAAATPTATSATEAQGPRLLLDEGGKFYLVVSTLSSQAQTDEYLSRHRDVAEHALVQHSGKHFRVCVARARTAARLYSFMGELPEGYGSTWVYEDK